MKMDQISASAWTSVIDGTQKVQFEFLALQLFVGNLRKRWRAGEITTQDCIRELKGFYAKFGRLPMAEKDFNKIADRGQPLANRLLDRAETARRIAAGQSLMLAGEEALLASLPPGNWIGGTIPYFMTQDGGCLCKDKIFVTEIPGDFPATIHRYAEAELPGIYRGSRRRNRQPGHSAGRQCRPHRVCLARATLSRFWPPSAHRLDRGH